MSNVEDQTPSKGSRFTTIKEYFDAEIEESWSDLILFLCCFITGLLDSGVFNVWSCFVSMQTGMWCHGTATSILADDL